MLITGTRLRKLATAAVAFATAGVALVGQPAWAAGSPNASAATPTAAAPTVVVSTQHVASARAALLDTMRRAHATPTGPVQTQSVPGPVAGCVGDKAMSGGTSPYGVVQVFFTFTTDCNAADNAVTRVGGMVTGSYCFSGVSGSGCTQLPGWSPYYINGKYVVYTAVQTCYTSNLGRCNPTSVSAVHTAIYFAKQYDWND